MQRRPYGNTGEELSLVGFGGIAVMTLPQAEADEAVAWAVERGVNYFDVAPSYGAAQDRLGPALRPYRDRVFLACKTGRRDAMGAREELENSLRVLQTDHFDLYQHHGFTRPEEVEQVFAPGGAMEVFLQARDEGKVRFLGFSAHDEQAAIMAMERFPFDSILFPFNAVLMGRGFGQKVLEAGEARGVARLGLKALSWTKVQEGDARPYPQCWYHVQDKPELADLLLRYALDLPLTATVPPGAIVPLKLAVELASRYQPLTEAEGVELRTLVADVEPIFECQG